MCSPRSLLLPTGYTTRHQGQKISDTVEFFHQTITIPLITPEECILHGLTTLTDVLTDVPTAQSDPQCQSIAALLNAYYSWATPNEKPDPSITIPRPTPAQTRRAMKKLERKPKQPPITHHPTLRVTNKPARCDQAPRRKIHQHVPDPSPRVNPKETPP